MRYTIVYTDDEYNSSAYGIFTDRARAQVVADRMREDLTREDDPGTQWEHDDRARVFVVPIQLLREW